MDFFLFTPLRLFTFTPYSSYAKCVCIPSKDYPSKDKNTIIINCKMKLLIHPHLWSLRMGKFCHDTLCWACNYLSMRQHPRPAKIRKCDRELSVTVSYSDPLHGKVHHDIKFQSIMENLKLRGTWKNWPTMHMATSNSDLLHHTVQP